MRVRRGGEDGADDEDSTASKRVTIRPDSDGRNKQERRNAPSLRRGRVDLMLLAAALLLLSCLSDLAASAAVAFERPSESALQSVAELLEDEVSPLVYYDYLDGDADEDGEAFDVFQPAEKRSATADEHLLRYGRSQQRQQDQERQQDRWARYSRAAEHLLRFNKRDPDDHLLRYNKRGQDRATRMDHLLRFNKRGEDHLLRFNKRGGDDHLLRFNKRGGDDHLLRFNKRGDDHLLRFNKKGDSHLLRFNRANGKYKQHLLRFNKKGSDEHLLRFTRGGDDHLLRFNRATDNHLLRFNKRSGDDHLLRFNRAMAADDQHLLRGVRTPEEVDEDLEPILGDPEQDQKDKIRQDFDDAVAKFSQNTDLKRSSHLLRFNRAANDHLLRFNRANDNHLLRFNKRSSSSSSPSEFHLLRYARQLRQQRNQLPRMVRQDDHLLRYN